MIEVAWQPGSAQKHGIQCAALKSVSRFDVGP